MSADGQGTKCRRNIAENSNRLSREHERYRQTTEGLQHIANVNANVNVSLRSLEFTFAKKTTIRSFRALICGRFRSVRPQNRTFEILVHLALPRCQKADKNAVNNWAEKRTRIHELSSIRSSGNWPVLTSRGVKWRCGRGGKTGASVERSFVTAAVQRRRR